MDGKRECWSAVAGIAGQLAGDRLSTGDKAALRRMDVLNPGREILALTRVLDAASVEPRTQDETTRWRLIVHCLALVEGRHSPNARAGTELFRAGYSEARLNALLSGDFDVYCDLLSVLARRLRAAQINLDWAPLAQIALFAGRKESLADKARVIIARDYATATYNEKA
ncbi:MAG: type I-E CRISPR-associated protein Cse2/CasB [Hyphomicrobiales bacterium]|nr:type I-E CRISPR-associated protein Cse2/CasB [Hyphomicrobiales bacterium]